MENTPLQTKKYPNGHPSLKAKTRFSNLNSKVLLEKLRESARQEKALTLQIVELIAEMNRRRLYLPLGYSTLYDFVTRDLGYEPASAMRRIQASRLYLEVPETKEKLSSGALTLSVAAQAQSFFRKQEQQVNKKFTRNEKKEILQKLENQSTREAERTLLSMIPQEDAIKHLEKSEKVRAVTDTHTELKLILDPELKDKLDELKNLLAHQNPDLSYKGVIALLAEQALKKIKRKDAGRAARAATSVKMDPTSAAEIKSNRKEARVGSEEAIPTPAPETPFPEKQKCFDPSKKAASSKKTRFIPMSVKKEVLERDQYRCQYQDPRTGVTCGAQAFLQFDHIKRFRHGGSNTVQNLRVHCASHNAWRG